MAMSAQPGHEALPVIFQDLDQAFHGVTHVDPFVRVAMEPDTPVLVGAFDHPIAGRLFDLRAVISESTPITNRIIELAASNEELVPEGHLRMTQSAEDKNLCRVEVRYCVAMKGADQHYLVQLVARLSRSSEVVIELMS